MTQQLVQGPPDGSLAAFAYRLPPMIADVGLDKLDISVLSDEFLAEVRGMPHRNLAVELLQKLLKGELATHRLGAGGGPVGGVGSVS